MDEAAFEAWARARRRPPGLKLDQSESPWAYLRRHYWWPARKRLFESAMWSVGLYAAGLAEARGVRLTAVDVPAPGLDSGLDGFRILHLSDLHLGSLDGVPEAIGAVVGGVEADLCVLTGDYAPRYSANPNRVVAALRAVLGNVRARHGILLTLGNYDSARLAAGLLADECWRLLINAQHRIEHDGSPLTITGLDDPYQQPHAPLLRALTEPAAGFRIVLAHAPELAAAAAEAGAGLYLCGHTHGGQICLPGGRPVFTNTRRPDLARGFWREGAMAGYTTRGAGVSGICRRHNCPPEVALLTLRAAPTSD